MIAQKDLQGYLNYLGQQISEEIWEAVAKHGIDQTPANNRMDPKEKLVILVEEVGEVARAMTYDEASGTRLREELLQVAAMAGAWWISMVDTAD